MTRQGGGENLAGFLVGGSPRKCKSKEMICGSIATGISRDCSEWEKEKYEGAENVVKGELGGRERDRALGLRIKRTGAHT